MPFQSKYTYDEKLNVCNHYVVEGGNSKSAHRATGIPHATIREWTKQAWWGEMVAEIRKRHQDRLDGKFTALIDKAMREMKDRLEHGDEILVAKTGALIRKKMSGKDIMLSLATIIDKRALQRGDPTSRKSVVTVEKRLEELQRGLEEMVKKDKDVNATTH